MPDKTVTFNLKNSDYAMLNLNIVERSLEELTDIIVKAKEIAIAQASDFYDGDVRKNVSNEIVQLRKQLVAIANKRFGNRYIFSGFKSLTKPFSDNGEYLGDKNHIKIEVGKDFFVPINLHGEEVFFSEEKEKPIHIITDIRPNMFFGRDTLKSVSACYIAATLAWACIKNDDRAGGIIFGPNDHKEIKPKKSSRSVLQIINALQTFSETLAKAYTEGNLTDDTYSLTKMLSEARRIISPGCSIFIISDFMDLNGQCDQYLFELAKIGSINFCHIFDSFEQTLPKDRSLKVGNSDRQINLDTRDRLMRVKHEQLFKYRLDKLNEMRTKLNAELLSFETNHDYLNTLMLHYGGGKNRNKRRPSFAN